MILFPAYNDNKAAHLYSAAFLFWRYRFYTDRIEVDRRFFFVRSTVISTDKIEMIASESDPILSHFGRCNLTLASAGNLFTLWGVPHAIADSLMEPPARRTDASDGTVRIYAKDLLRRSALHTKLVRYLLLLAIIWGTVFLMGSDFIDSQKAHALSAFVFRHLLVAGTLVLSLGLPTVLLWLWAFTGGFLLQYLKYYRYTAERRGNLLYLSYGAIFRRRICLDLRRVTLVEFRQPPLMRIFGYGELRLRAVGYNFLFRKSKLILPLIREKDLPDGLSILFPEFFVRKIPRCRRSLLYDFISWKMLLPLLCGGLSFFWGWQWLIAAGALALWAAVSILLEYRNTSFAFSQSDRSRPTVILSKGGFYRTTAWIHQERVEMMAISGSRRKLRRGYANIRIRVFDKSGRYALVRNVDIRLFDGELPL